MKNIFYTIIIYGITAAVLLFAETPLTVNEKQERVLSLLNEVNHDTGIVIRGQGRISMDMEHGTGNGMDTNYKVRQFIPYVQSDLSLTASPYPEIESTAVIRLQNDLHGFYGTGDLLLLRQLWVEAVLWQCLRVRVGDFNEVFSEYTLWAPVQEIAFSPEIFKQKIISDKYDYFLNDEGSRPLQGIKIKMGILSAILIDKIEINGFAARDKISPYERIISGAKLQLLKKDRLELAGNFVSFNDIHGTSEVVEVTNTALSAQIVSLQSTIIITKNISLFGEYAGNQAKAGSLTSVSDYGLDAGFIANYRDNWLKFNYHDVGNEFYSPGAQTSTYNTLSSPFFRDQNLKPFVFNRTYDYRINYNRQSDVPSRLIYPMNLTTPNRTGFVLNFTSHMFKFLDYILEGNVMNEIRPYTCKKIRNFWSTETGAKIKFPLNINLTGNFFYETVKRSDDPDSAGKNEKEDFSNITHSIGVEVNELGPINIYLGVQRFFVSGIRWMELNQTTNPLSESLAEKYYDKKEEHIQYAGAVVYKIKADSFLRCDYVISRLKSHKDSSYDYSISSLQIEYMLKF